MQKNPNLLVVSIVTFGLSILSIFVLRFGFNVPILENSAATVLSQVKPATQKVFLLGGINSVSPYYMNDIFSSTDGKNWKLISSQNATTTTKWSPRDDFGYNTVYFNNKIWVIGGLKDPATVGGQIAQDVWSSVDGISWTQEGTLPFIADEIHPVVFNNAIWVIGGANGGLNNPIWYSSNGTQWIHQDTNLTLPGIQDSPWNSKYKFTFTVFKNKMWVLGGQNSISSLDTNDIWSSVNGTSWVHEDTDSLTSGIQDASWNAREGHTALVFNDKLYILGGANSSSGSTSVNVDDVWSSVDGIHWTLVLAHAPWAIQQLSGSSFPGVRLYHSSFVLGNKIFLVAGQKPSLSCSTTGCTQPSNDIWSSTDGLNWTQVITTGDPISVRYGHSTVVIPIPSLQK
jgi:hypothetical protein